MNVYNVFVEMLERTRASEMLDQFFVLFCDMNYHSKKTHGVVKVDKFSKSDIIVSPSILSANFSKLGDQVWFTSKASAFCGMCINSLLLYLAVLFGHCQVKAVELAGCDWIHVDVMDGRFVPNITIGPLVVDALRPVTDLPLDVHLVSLCSCSEFHDVFFCLVPLFKFRYSCFR